LLGTPQPLSQQLFLAKPDASGHGNSIMSQLYDVTSRFWKDLVSRLSSPLAFRFLDEFAEILLPTPNFKPVRIARVERNATRETRLLRRG
jgi:hypothetical protein